MNANQWRKEIVCKGAYDEFWIQLDSKCGEVRDGYVNVCSDEFMFSHDDIEDAMTSRELNEIATEMENLIKKKPHVIEDFYADNEDEETLNKCGIKTTGRGAWVTLDKEDTVKKFKDGTFTIGAIV